jgi:hypothetical protein
MKWLEHLERFSVNQIPKLLCQYKPRSKIYQKRPTENVKNSFSLIIEKCQQFKHVMLLLLLLLLLMIMAVAYLFEVTDICINASPTER